MFFEVFVAIAVVINSLEKFCFKVCGGIGRGGDILAHIFEFLEGLFFFIDILEFFEIVVEGIGFIFKYGELEE